MTLNITSLSMSKLGIMAFSKMHCIITTLSIRICSIILSIWIHSIMAA
jgi:hypothetical protein